MLFSKIVIISFTHVVRLEPRTTKIPVVFDRWTLFPFFDESEHSSCVMQIGPCVNIKKDLTGGQDSPHFCAGGSYAGQNIGSECVGPVRG